eukprot:13263523-Alexandrium_andersonii.AAC.1
MLRRGSSLQCDVEDAGGAGGDSGYAAGSEEDTQPQDSPRRLQADVDLGALHRNVSRKTRVGEWYEDGPLSLWDSLVWPERRQGFASTTACAAQIQTWSSRRRSATSSWPELATLRVAACALFASI